MGYRYAVTTAIVFMVGALVATILAPSDRARRWAPVVALPALFIVTAAAVQGVLQTMFSLGAFWGSDFPGDEHSTATGLLAIAGGAVGLAVVRWGHVSLLERFGMRLRGGLLPPLPGSVDEAPAERDATTGTPSTPDPEVLDDGGRFDPGDENGAADDADADSQDTDERDLPLWGLTGLAFAIAAQAPPVLHEWSAGFGRVALAQYAETAFVAAIAAVGFAALWGSLEAVPVLAVGLVGAAGALGVSWAGSRPLTGAVAGLGLGLIFLPAADAVTGAMAQAMAQTRRLPVPALGVGLLLVLAASLGAGLAQPNFGPPGNDDSGFLSPDDESTPPEGDLIVPPGGVVPRQSPFCIEPSPGGELEEFSGEKICFGIASEVPAP